MYLVSVGLNFAVILIIILTLYRLDQSFGWTIMTPTRIGLVIHHQQQPCLIHPPWLYPTAIIRLSSSSSSSNSDLCTTTSSSSSSFIDNSSTLSREEEKEEGGVEEEEKAKEELYQQYIQQPAQVLKQQLERLNINTKGRKPDLAKRLVEYSLLWKKEKEERNETTAVFEETIMVSNNESNITQRNEEDNDDDDDIENLFGNISSSSYIPRFATIPISHAASNAILQARIQQPTIIQQKAIPILYSSFQNKMKKSLILHAETGSGKTLAYLLPITEYAWKCIKEEDNTDNTWSRSFTTTSKFKIIQNQSSKKQKEENDEEEKDNIEYALILTPNRELAIQVASVAQVLAPPNSVRLIPFPTNIVRDSYKNKEQEGFSTTTFKTTTDTSKKSRIQIIIGSAQTIYQSLFGNQQDENNNNSRGGSTLSSSSSTAASSPRFLVEESTTSITSSLSSSTRTSMYDVSPTSKPETKYFLRKVSYLVLDEIDRLLIGTGSTSTFAYKSKYYKKHEKPAAILTSTIIRQTLGQVQMIGVSATVGRPLRREVARILGISPKEGPLLITSQVVVEEEEEEEKMKLNHKEEEEEDTNNNNTMRMNSTNHHRVITIPSTVQHYIFPCDGSTNGKLVTSATFMIKALLQNQKDTIIRTTTTTSRRILLVIAKDIGIQVSYILGAMNHFGIQPKPILLSQYLLSIDEDITTSSLIENHHLISKCIGLGQDLNKTLNKDGYIIVTSEDDIRGLHLHDLDIVVLVGRPKGPDEYLHIAGRTGRGGKSGKIINVVSYEQGQALTSWEKMLNIGFIPIEQRDVSLL